MVKQTESETILLNKIGSICARHNLHNRRRKKPSQNNISHWEWSYLELLVPNSLTNYTGHVFKVIQRFNSRCHITKSTTVKYNTHRTHIFKSLATSIQYAWVNIIPHCPCRVTVPTYMCKRTTTAVEFPIQGAWFTKDGQHLLEMKLKRSSFFSSWLWRFHSISKRFSRLTVARVINSAGSSKPQRGVCAWEGYIAATTERLFQGRSTSATSPPIGSGAQGHLPRPSGCLWRTQKKKAVVERILMRVCIFLHIFEEGSYLHVVTPILVCHTFLKNKNSRQSGFWVTGCRNETNKILFSPSWFEIKLPVVSFLKAE